jgi:hypothetical protein
VDPRAGLDDLKRTFLTLAGLELPYRDSNSNSSVIQPIASCYTDCAIPTPDRIIRFI